MRRTRQADWARRLTRETVLTKNDLIWALIVHDGAEPRIPVGAMPGVDRLNLDQAVEAARTARALGIPALALFPHIDPSKKDAMVNYRVRDLDAMLAQLRANGCDVDPRVEDGEFGRFGWVMDPEGNRIELWQPPASGGAEGEG